MNKFIGQKRINIDGRHDYMLRVSNRDVDASLMNYLLLIERVEVVEAGEEGLTEICHLKSNELVECMRMPFAHIEIYRNKQVGSKEYDVLLLGVNLSGMWFSE